MCIEARTECKCVPCHLHLLQLLSDLLLQVHCILVITFMMGAERKERYNEKSVIMK